MSLSSINKKIIQRKNLQKLIPLLEVFYNFMFNESNSQNISFISTLKKMIYQHDVENGLAPNGIFETLVVSFDIDNLFQIRERNNKFRLYNDDYWRVSPGEAIDTMSNLSIEREEDLDEFFSFDNKEKDVFFKRTLKINLSIYYQITQNLEILGKMFPNSNSSFEIDYDKLYSVYPILKNNPSYSYRVRNDILKFKDIFGFYGILGSKDIVKKIDNIENIEDEYIGNSFFYPEYYACMESNVIRKSKKQITNFKLPESLNYGYIYNYEPIMNQVKYHRFKILMKE